MNLLEPKLAFQKGKFNELNALRILYEEGCATAAQIGYYSLGQNFNPRFSQHYRILRRLHKLSQVAWFRGPLRDRLFYLTHEGAARIKEELDIPADCWLGNTDYHSGRSGITILHDLGVIDCRLRLRNTKYTWASKSIVQAAWSKIQGKPKYIPDAVIGRKSNIAFWPINIPFAIEFERSSKSWTSRALKIYRATNYLGQSIAGILLVTRESQHDLWHKTFDQLNADPNFEILTRKGKQILSINPTLLRFLTITTLKEIDSSLESARAAYLKNEIAPFPWTIYQSWLRYWEDVFC